MALELWSIASSSARQIVNWAQRAEESGLAGMVVTDSQNLAGDCYVALTAAAAATTRLRLGTGVTNPVNLERQREVAVKTRFSTLAYSAPTARSTSSGSEPVT